MLAFIDSPIEWAVVLLVAILLFGHKLPSVARSLGQSISEFKKGVREGEAEASQTTMQQQPPSIPLQQVPPPTQTQVRENINPPAKL